MENQLLNFIFQFHFKSKNLFLVILLLAEVLFVPQFHYFFAFRCSLTLIHQNCRVRTFQLQKESWNLLQREFSSGSHSNRKINQFCHYLN